MFTGAGSAPAVCSKKTVERAGKAGVMEMLVAKILLGVAALNLLFLAFEVAVNVLRLYFG
jgi:hypothetical protein